MQGMFLVEQVFVVVGAVKAFVVVFVVVVIGVVVLVLKNSKHNETGKNRQQTKDFFPQKNKD